jgi:hypothetical protein
LNRHSLETVVIFLHIGRTTVRQAPVQAQHLRSVRTVVNWWRSGLIYPHQHPLRTSLLDGAGECKKTLSNSVSISDRFIVSAFLTSDESMKERVYDVFQFDPLDRDYAPGALDSTRLRRYVWRWMCFERRQSGGMGPCLSGEGTIRTGKSNLGRPSQQG